MKKKALTVALMGVLLTLLVSGTLAFFTAENETTNTFTVGSVEIEIYENGKETDEDTVSFGRLIPVVNEDPGADANYIDKVVEVKSTGKNAAYVRVHIAIPTSLVGYLKTDINTDGWVLTGTTETKVRGVAYTVHTYDWQKKVEPGTFTAELLRGVYLANDVDIQDNPATPAEDLEFCKPNGDGTYRFSGFAAHSKTSAGYSTNTVSVLVAAEGMQDRGFENAAQALDAGFGANTNPWQ